jgi:uncharacterized membrane protein
LGLVSGIGFFVLFIYYFVLSQAPKKTEKDKKIVLILTGVFIGPLLFTNQANTIQITILVFVWLILIWFSFSNRSLSKRMENLLFVFGFAGYVLGKYAYS